MRAPQHKPIDLIRVMKRPVDAGRLCISTTIEALAGCALATGHGVGYDAGTDLFRPLCRLYTFGVYLKRMCVPS